ncbi:MAG: hypothetical protein Q8O10_10315 [candidate division Zixibacteria bacterium]|nr:hypothetical protein [candidate division Zixibacteria bacterium]
MIDNNVIGVKTLDGDRNALFELFGKLLGDGYHLVYVNGNKKHQLERWDFGLERTVLFLQLLNNTNMRKGWNDLVSEDHAWGYVVSDGDRFKAFIGELREKMADNKDWGVQYNELALVPGQTTYQVMWNMLGELVTLPINERIALIRDLRIPCFCKNCWKRAPFFLFRKWCRYVFRSFVRRWHKQ